MVAVEARFPAATTALRPPGQRALRDHLGSDWVIEGAKEQTVEIALASGVPGNPVVKTEEVTRITMRDRTVAVTVRPERLTIEATSYRGYPAFREILRRAFEAVEDVLRPDGVIRLGLRYIDEIRVPGLTEPSEWVEWIDPSLLSSRADGLVAVEWTGAAQYQTGAEQRLVLRHGTSDGPVVDPSGPLRRPLPPPTGPVFVLDFDSFWQPDLIPAFRTPDLLVACDQLRGPARSLFDQLLTDRLIDDVFRKDPLA
ncbi:MAG: TIGR04255 family protein [Acidimicrobiales bacterium]|nr:TIGR04255 family protein [Acidimicrobiales bacterium]